MLVTIFYKKEEPLYRKAVKLFGKKELYVDTHAYVNGVLDESASALRLSVPMELTKFWEIFDGLKTEAGSGTTKSTEKKEEKQ